MNAVKHGDRRIPLYARYARRTSWHEILGCIWTQCPACGHKFLARHMRHHWPHPPLYGHHWHNSRTIFTGSHHGEYPALSLACPKCYWDWWTFKRRADSDAWEASEGIDYSKDYGTGINADPYYLRTGRM